jgi:medium-chain acyl-[acyl-carrier-protein] hydrolase
VSRSLSEADDWFIPLAAPATAGAHPYAFPQAGAGVTAFAALAARLAPVVCVWALNLPGRQARFHEPPRTDLGPLVDEVADDLSRRPCGALLGYCSGALLAFLAARRLRDRERWPPTALGAVSYPAPDRASPPRELHAASGEEFWREIMSYGGVPTKVAAQPDFRQIFEPALRADYELLAGYEFTGAAPLDVPVTVIHGNPDPVLTAADIAGWRAHTRAGCTTVAVGSGHWLLDTDPDGLAAAVRVLVSATPVGPEVR